MGNALQLVRPWSRIGPALLVCLTMTVAIGLVVVPAYFLGKQWEDDRRFLKNYRAPNDYETQINFAMNYAVNSNEDNPVVFHGDSTCLVNLRPNLFEELTGVKAYNLGSVGVIGFDGIVWMLRAYLEHHPKPRILVLCFHPRALTEPPLHFGPREVREPFVWCYGTGTEDTRPPHRKPVEDYIRQGLWILYGHATGGFEHYANDPVYRRQGRSYNILAAEMVAERGYWEQPGQLEHFQPRGLIPEPFAMLPENEKGLLELARLTEEQGIRLLIRLAPLAREDGAKDSSGLRAWSAALEGGFRNVKVSTPEVLQYDGQYFSDLDHLNRAGADRFTAFVSEEVMKMLGKK